MRPARLPYLSALFLAVIAGSSGTANIVMPSDLRGDLSTLNDVEKTRYQEKGVLCELEQFVPSEADSYVRGRAVVALPSLFVTLSGSSV